STVTSLDLGKQAVASLQTLTATTGLIAGDSFTLTFGTDTTTSLPGTVTPAQVQTALNNLASITNAGGVTVAQSVGTLLDTNAAALLYSRQTTGASTGPTTAWTPLSSPTTTAAVSAAFSATAAAVDSKDTFLTATQPGMYTFHFADDMNSPGTGDDSVSPTFS